MTGASEGTGVGAVRQDQHGGGSNGVRRAKSLSARSLPLWVGVLAPPLAWAAHLVLGDGIFELGCARGVAKHRLFGLSLRTWALIQTSVMASVTVVAGLLAYRAWRRLNEIPDGVALERAKAMAVAGIASAGVYLSIIVFGFFPPLFLRACGTSL
jgi:hypothetical protein